MISLDNYEFIRAGGRDRELRRAIGVPKDMRDTPISAFFNKPGATIVIDHFDDFMYGEGRDDGIFDEKHAPKTIQMVIDLIKESTLSRNFNVLLVLNSWEHAKELMDVGCKLIPSDTPARWTKGQLETIFDTLPEAVKSKVCGKKDEVMRLVALSGTPGFLTFHAHNAQLFDASYAAMHDLEWRRGMKALYNRHDLDLAPHTEEGRFPDRNGIYHHEDLAVDHSGDADFSSKDHEDSMLDHEEIQRLRSGGGAAVEQWSEAVWRAMRRAEAAGAAA